MRNTDNTAQVVTHVEVEGAQESDQHAVVGDVAQTYDRPTAHTVKIMTQLAKARILRSDMGAMGGFRLAHPANNFSFLKIYEAANGQLGDGQMRDIPWALGRSVGAALGQVMDGAKNVLGDVKLTPTDLAIKRVGEKVDEAFGSAIHGASRRGILNYEGNLIWREE